MSAKKVLTLDFLIVKYIQKERLQYKKTEKCIESVSKKENKGGEIPL